MKRLRRNWEVFAVSGWDGQEIGMNFDDLFWTERGASSYARSMNRETESLRFKHRYFVRRRSF